ncbi:MAG: hypothetical protein HOK21_12820 [Rhodospirillaceae bacterium]|mgnify:CR=1 FL=1|jgi:predicted transcriptional regulator|nr:hypothetical protein [Rhodospirillales bacterium]MBT5079124.1 hypothetical protein [Rhodospirillaceae bacterium]MBT5524966.1 hypothetical protein [Rhodospirillaceae bacterium]MBT5880305.1 hypothetical protein [Rhodospirillaceae bacterium]MBT6985326.1 hypothetical protein [Rhodospirillaceae bacterium]
MRTRKAVDTLTDITSRLDDVMAKENQILLHRRPHELAGYAAEKQDLATAYEREMAELHANPSLLDHAEPEEISRLKSATKRFQQVLEEHRRLVQTTKSVTDRMLKAITDEVSAKQRPVEGYDQTATMRTPFNRNSRPVSLALNQVV